MNMGVSPPTPRGTCWSPCVWMTETPVSLIPIWMMMKSWVKPVASVSSGIQSSELSEADLNPTNDQGLPVISGREESQNQKNPDSQKWVLYPIPYVGIQVWYLTPLKLRDSQIRNCMIVYESAQRVWKRCRVRG